MQTPPVVVARSLTKRFREKTAVDGLDLTLVAGERVLLLGPNGAGKTTTLLMLLGAVTPDAGTIDLVGHRLPKGRTGALARAEARRRWRLRAITTNRTPFPTLTQCSIRVLTWAAAPFVGTVPAAERGDSSQRRGWSCRYERRIRTLPPCSITTSIIGVAPTRDSTRASTASTPRCTARSASPMTRNVRSLAASGINVVG